MQVNRQLRREATQMACSLIAHGHAPTPPQAAGPGKKGREAQLGQQQQQLIDWQCIHQCIQRPMQQCSGRCGPCSSRSNNTKRKNGPARQHGRQRHPSTPSHTRPLPPPQLSRCPRRHSASKAANTRTAPQHQIHTCIGAQSYNHRHAFTHHGRRPTTHGPPHCTPPRHAPSPQRFVRQDRRLQRRQPCTSHGRRRPARPPFTAAPPRAP